LAQNCWYSTPFDIFSLRRSHYYLHLLHLPFNANAGPTHSKDITRFTATRFQSSSATLKSHLNISLQHYSPKVRTGKYRHHHQQKHCCRTAQRHPECRAPHVVNTIYREKPIPPTALLRVRDQIAGWENHHSAEDPARCHAHFAPDAGGCRAGWVPFGQKISLRWCTRMHHDENEHQENGDSDSASKWATVRGYRTHRLVPLPTQ